MTRSFYFIFVIAPASDSNGVIIITIITTVIISSNNNSTRRFWNVNHIIIQIGRYISRTLLFYCYYYYIVKLFGVLHNDAAAAVRRGDNPQREHTLLGLKSAVIETER